MGRDFRAFLSQIAEAEDLELVAGVGAREGDGLFGVPSENGQ